MLLDALDFERTSDENSSVGGGVLGSILSGALDLIGKVWSLPNTVLGLVAGGVGYVAGTILGTNPGVSIGNNAIQFTNLPLGASGGGALTLGNVQLYHNAVPTESVPRYDQTATVNLGRHEEAHTYQSQVLGPFFLPVYFATGGISTNNPLEAAADNYAAGGRWWPWP